MVVWIEGDKAEGRQSPGKDNWSELVKGWGVGRKGGLQHYD